MKMKTNCQTAVSKVDNKTSILTEKAILKNSLMIIKHI